VKGLQFCYDHPAIVEQWAREGRRTAKQYDKKSFVNAHTKLYREILEDRYPGLLHLRKPNKKTRKIK
jgi:hypothetical protein